MAADVPGAGSSHGDPGQRNPAGVAVELGDGLLQSQHGHLFHRAVPLLVIGALGEDHHTLITIAETLQRGRQTDADLPDIVVAPLPASMKVEHHRPAPELGVMGRKPDPVAESLVVH